MKINGKTILDKLIWLITAALFFSVNAFIMESWGRYVLAGAAILIFLLSILRNKGVIRLTFTPWHGFFLAFIVYCAVTSFWSESPGGARGTSQTLFLILFCYSFVYIPHWEDMDVEKMLKAVKWGGFAVVIYAFLYYGYDEIVKMMEDELRIESEMLNANVLGTVAAISIIIQCYEFTKRKRLNIGMLFCIPSVIMVAVAQSREALIVAIAGVLLVFATEMFDKKINLKSFLKAFLTVAVVVAIVIGVLQLPMFAGLNSRMEEFGSLFSDKSGDASIRKRLIDLGWEHFLKNPIGGVGFGTPRLLAKRYLGMEFYMHNNFIELLCGGGIIAFGIYYGMYIYLFYNMYKYRKFRDGAYRLCLVMMLLMLILDYAIVSAYEKNMWFYFMIFFLEAQRLKKRSQEYAAEQTVASRKTVSNG